MTISTVIDHVFQTSKNLLVTVGAGAVELVPLANVPDGTRVFLTVAGPCSTVPNDNYCFVIAETAAEANAGEGEIIAQNFAGNDNEFEPKVEFDTRKGAQNKKWVKLLTGLNASYTLNINEYLG